ncbi:S9 family peptidase [Hellea sp.]|nr:S9 family peptidase [Hellea sp.]
MSVMKTIRAASLISLSTFLSFSLGGFNLSDIAFAKPNIDIYAQLPRTASVRISPDGKYVAMLAPYQANKAIFVYNLENPDANTIIIPTPDDSIVKAIDWASDKHVIMLARIRGKGEGKMKRYSALYSRWVATNVETQKSNVMMDDRIKERSYRSQYGGSYVHDLPDDPDHIIMDFPEYTGAVVNRYYKVNLDTGKEFIEKNVPIRSGRVLRSRDGNEIIAREEYNSSNGKYEVFYGYGLDEELVYSADFDTSKNRTTYLFAEYQGKLLFQETERSGLTLFTIDPKTKARAPFMITADVPSGYEYGPIFDPQTGELIGVGFTEDVYKEVYSAEPYKTWHMKAENTLKGKDITILSRTRDDKFVTLLAQGPKEPGEFYLFEPDLNQISPLGGSYPELKPSEIGLTIRSDFKARDGLEIPAYLTLPPGKSKSDGPMPMVVLPHGGPIARDDAGFDFWAQYLAAQGYVVFKPQFRGSSGFGYDFESAGYGEFGDGMLEDTIDGVNYLVETGVANPDKICVTGASYGGYQALALPVIKPEMFKCALAVNGVSDIPDILKFEVARTGSKNSAVMKFWEKVIGDRRDDKDMMKEQSPARNAEDIKAEIVLVHGEDDMTVPVQQTKIMAKALKQAGKSSDVIYLPNDDHNLSLAQSRKKLLEESDKLFGKYLD